MNKKSIIYLATALVIGTAVNVFAEAASDKTWSTTAGAEQVYGSAGRPTLSVKPSTGVYLYLDSAIDSGKTYLCASFHNTGTKVYSSTSASTKIYMTEKPATGNPTNVPAMVAATAGEPVWTGWTAN